VAFSGYAQRDPLIEYQDQGFRRFQALINTIDSTIVRTLLQSEFSAFAPQAMVTFDEEEREAELATNAADIEGALTETGVKLQQQQAAASPQGIPSALLNPAAQRPSRPASTPQQRNVQQVGRNDVCPCGSGKKYKKCHGKNS
jgi:preprotein translocase subunit SecA